MGWFCERTGGSVVLGNRLDDNSLRDFSKQTHPRNGYNRYQIIPQMSAYAGIDIRKRAKKVTGVFQDPSRAEECC
jgi:hypothetical protein